MISSFVIKIIAGICMICDHSSDTILQRFSFLSVIGRIAFPLFCFQLALGFRYTHNKKKYFEKLLIFALVSQIPFILMLKTFTYDYLHLNVIFTFLLAFTSLYVLENKKLVKPLKFILTLFIMFMAYLLKTDYSFYGVYLVLVCYYLYPLKNKIWYLLGYIGFMTINSIHFMNSGATINQIFYINVGLLVSYIITLLYNGKKGKSVRLFLLFLISNSYDDTYLYTLFNILK